jgi:hypothetical protein
MTPLDFARQDIGYTETPVNKTKYGEWYGWNGVAWCVQAVQYWYAKAGHPLPLRPPHLPHLLIGISKTSLTK